MNFHVRQAAKWQKAISKLTQDVDQRNYMQAQLASDFLRARLRG